jgi:hypothetical protein
MTVTIRAAHLLIIGGLAAGLAGCSGSAAALSCDEIATQAQAASQTQGTPVTRFKDVREQASTETEKRCTATAEVEGTGDVTVYLRGYEDETGNQMVAFQEQPFE